MYVSFATWDITHKPQPKDNWMVKNLFLHLFSSFFLEALLETVRHEKSHTPNPMPKICCSKMSPDHPEGPHPPLPRVFRILPIIKIPSQHQYHQVLKEGTFARETADLCGIQNSLYCFNQPALLFFNLRVGVHSML